MLLDSATVLANRYRLDRRLADGPFSQVWRATDLELARPVAIKVLDPAFGRDAAALEHFRTVSSRASSLVHEGIVRIFDYCEPASADDPHGPFLVMELVEGSSVAELLSAGPLDARRSLGLVAQVAAALAVTHKAGLVHGDVKPENLLVTRDGVVKLIDLVSAGRSDPAGPDTAAEPASDLYALGVTAGQCLSGRINGDSSDPQAALPHGVPSPVAELIRDLTATDPANAGQFAARARQLRRQVAAPARSANKAPAQGPATTRTSNGSIHQVLSPQQAPSPTSLVPAQIGVPEARIATIRAVGVPVPARARLPLSTRMSAVILLAIAGLTGYAFLKPSSLPQADHVSHVTTVTVTAADLTGLPVSAARSRLERLGLVVTIRWLPTGQTGPGRVIAVSPTGRVPVGTVVTLTGSSPASAGQQPGSLASHAPPPAHRSPGHPSASASPPSPAPTPTPSPTPSPTGSPSPSPSPPPTGTPPASSSTPT